MNIPLLPIAGIAVATAAVATAVFFTRPAPPAIPEFISPSNTALVTRGKIIYERNCASCHGFKLEGQPDWRQRLPNGRLPAPPHDVTGHTWHHPDHVLIDIVKHGLVPGKTAPEGYESDMPAYSGSLKDEDILAVLAYIKSSWPAEAIEAQRNITQQDITQQDK